ncbi:MAG: hypothetical protein V1855_02100 [bacterium]
MVFVLYKSYGKNFFRLFFFTSIVFLSSCFLNARAEGFNHNQRAKKSIESLYIRPVVAGMIFLSLLVHEMVITPGQKTLQHQCNFGALLKNFFVQYSSYFLSSFFHEIGHALAAKALNDDEIDVHVGGEDKKSPLFSFRGIYLDGLMPTMGHTVYTRPCQDKEAGLKRALILIADYYCKEKNLDPAQFSFKEIDQDELERICHILADNKELQKCFDVDKQKLGLILLAGGVSGILGYLIVKFLMQFVLEVKKSVGGVQASFSNVLASVTSLDGVIIMQLSNMMLPFAASRGRKSDAFMFYHECFGIEQKSLEKIEWIMPYFIIGAEYYLGRKSQAPWVKKLGTALVNVLLCGFLRFHA